MDLTPEQFARLEQLFTEAVHLAPSLGPAQLARVRSEDGPAIADRLEALLAAQSEQTEPTSLLPITPEVSSLEHSSFRAGDTRRSWIDRSIMITGPFLGYLRSQMPFDIPSCV